MGRMKLQLQADEHRVHKNRLLDEIDKARQDGYMMAKNRFEFELERQKTRYVSELSQQDKKIRKEYEAREKQVNEQKYNSVFDKWRMLNVIFKLKEGKENAKSQA